MDKSLNETATDKIRKYRADYNNNPPRTVSFMTVVASTSGRLHSEFIRLLFLQSHRETDRFLAASGVQLAQPNRGLFHLNSEFKWLNCCSLLIDKTRVKDKTYIWVSVRWKTKPKGEESTCLTCATFFSHEPSATLIAKNSRYIPRTTLSHPYHIQHQKDSHFGKEQARHKPHSDCVHVFFFFSVARCSFDENGVYTNEGCACF